ncbi:MAG TPA: hypothetical protein VF587_05145 [Solirubrobacteraceae bacterium]|jgi:hypothetical protein
MDSSTPPQPPSLDFPGDAAVDVSSGPWTTLVTNDVGGTSNNVWISLPGSGQLQIGFLIGTGPAIPCYLWHQGGAQTPVTQGIATYTSQPGDFLWYSLASPDQVIKLGWQYVNGS